MQRHDVTLAELHERIRLCRKCFEFSKSIIKPVTMDRGQIASILVIGVAPGRQEAGKGKAFCGPGGAVLFEWLRKAGIGDSEEHVRRNVYLTSMIKCISPDEKTYKRMVSNCVEFLYGQIRIIQPRVILTLGEKPLRLFAGSHHTLGGVVGKSFKERELRGGLFPLTSDTTVIIPFPHPSPRSRWAREQRNQVLLERGIDQLSVLARRQT